MELGRGSLIVTLVAGTIIVALLWPKPDPAPANSAAPPVTQTAVATPPTDMLPTDVVPTPAETPVDPPNTVFESSPDLPSTSDQMDNDSYDTTGTDMTGGGGQITYLVESSCPTDVTYTADGDGIQQESDVPDGWTADTSQSDLINTISAQLKCEGGDVTVNISLDGSLVKTATSSGDYSIASVSYP
jgi:hypothetical protein